MWYVWYNCGFECVCLTLFGNYLAGDIQVHCCAINAAEIIVPLVMAGTCKITNCRKEAQGICIVDTHTLAHQYVGTKWLCRELL